MQNPKLEDRTVDLFFKYGICNIEAAAYMQMTPSLVRYRLKGILKKSDGEIVTPNKIMAKISRPEVANFFMSPAPLKIVQKLLKSGELSQ